MTQLLSSEDKARVSEAIKLAESQSVGELITVIAPASDDYMYIPTMWAALFALVVPAIILLVGTWMDTATLFSIQVGAFVGLAFVFRIPAIKYLLVPKNVKRLRASRVAREQFFIQGLQNTQGRTGILLFVSVAERYVEVIADKGINDVVPSGTWDSVVNNFIARVKAGQHADGFIAAINECGDIMCEHFPVTGANPDELPNHLVEL